jgi:hypothetical protein
MSAARIPASRSRRGHFVIPVLPCGNQQIRLMLQIREKPQAGGLRLLQSRDG